MLTKFKSTFQEYPTKFWVLILATFIDAIGRTLVFPFFSLYITEKFNVGMTEAGVLLAIFSVSGLVGSMFGGALTDRFGRKGMVLFGLIFSALSSVSMGLVSDLSLFYGLAVFVGLLSSIAGPARQAMVADLLPEEKRADGFGLLRVALNLSWVIGPTIGGFVASQSYLTLFVADAITSLIVAGIFWRMIPETAPDQAGDKEPESFGKTFIGYRKVGADGAFMAFVLISIVMNFVYLQLYGPLSVYLRDMHGISTQGFGAMLSMNAFTVVLLQLWVTRQVGKRPPALMMAFGTIFYLIGFPIYGLASTYAWFIFAMMLITVGEMVVIPISQSLAAKFAPADMRGRYMALFGWSWSIPSIIGPLVAGLIMDNANPAWLWYICGILSVVSIVGFVMLHNRTRERLEKADETLTATPATASAATD